MMDVLILVPARDDPRPEDSWRPQFERLAAPLRARGLTVEAQPWTDAFDKGRARLVTPSLAWGYHGREAEWLGVLDRLERDGVRVARDVGVVHVAGEVPRDLLLLRLVGAHGGAMGRGRARAGERAERAQVELRQLPQGA